MTPTIEHSSENNTVSSVITETESRIMEQSVVMRMLEGLESNAQTSIHSPLVWMTIVDLMDGWDLPDENL